MASLQKRNPPFNPQCIVLFLLFPRLSFKYLLLWFHSILSDMGEYMIRAKFYRSIFSALILSLCISAFASAQSQWELVEETHIPGLISGTIQKGHIFTTASGSIYEVTGITLQLALELSPEVAVFRQGNVYGLVIVGFDEPLICRQLKSPRHQAGSAPSLAPSHSGVVESHIDGNFEGWSGQTIFRLTNGQIWQQASYAYTYHYAFRPKVMIYPSGGGYIMRVDGVRQTIQVRRLK